MSNLRYLLGQQDFKTIRERNFQFIKVLILSQVCDFNRLYLEYSNSAGRSDLVIFEAIGLAAVTAKHLGALMLSVLN